MTSKERQPELPLSREDRFALIRAARFKLPDSRVRSYAHVYRLLEILEVCTGPRGGVCRISQEVLADKMRVSRATLKRVLGLAKELRVLDVDARVGSGGQGLCEYQVDWARVGQWGRQPAETILYGRVIGVHAGPPAAQSSAVNGSAKNELALAHHEPALAHHELALAHDDPAYLSHSVHDSRSDSKSHETRTFEKPGKPGKRGGWGRVLTTRQMSDWFGVAALFELAVRLGKVRRTDVERLQFFALVHACKQRAHKSAPGLLTASLTRKVFTVIRGDDETAASAGVRLVDRAVAAGVVRLDDPHALLDQVERGELPRPAAPPRVSDLDEPAPDLRAKAEDYRRRLAARAALRAKSEGVTT